MDKQKETGNIFAFVVILIVIVAGFLTACKTSEKAITETILFDTVYIHKIDTVKEYKNIRVTDTLKQVLERIVTLGENGDTIRIVNNNNNYRYVEVRDSSSKYVARIDSLLKVLDVLHNEKEVKIKKPPNFIKWICICAFILSIPILMNIVKRLF